MIYQPINKAFKSTSYHENYKSEGGQQDVQQSFSKDQKSIKEQTKLLVWGYDSSGQLGLGQKQSGGNCYFSPKFCCFNIAIKQISCGLEHSSFLAQNGNVYMIGSNKQGQLGIGQRETVQRSVPVLIDSLSKHTIIKVSCGGNHTGAISSRGFVFMWGEGNEGQIGTGQQDNVYQPTQLEIYNARYISCGKKTTVVVAGQKAYGFGDCRQGQLGTGKKVYEYNISEIPLPSFEGYIKSVSCGDNHSLFLTDKGEIFSCGNNSFGQLGVGQETKSSIYLLKVHLNLPSSSHSQAPKVISIKAGYSPSSIALTDNGKLYIWGTGFFGYYDQPKMINRDGVFWKGCSLGNNFICLTDDKGRAYSWGQNINGELGLGLHSTYQQQAHPQQIDINMEEGQNIKKIECGQHCSFALIKTKKVVKKDINGNYENENVLSSANKNTFVSTQSRSSLTRKHAMLADQINSFSQQLQKFQNDYPSINKKNENQQNDDYTLQEYNQRINKKNDRQQNDDYKLQEYNQKSKESDDHLKRVLMNNQVVSNPTENSIHFQNNLSMHSIENNDINQELVNQKAKRQQRSISVGQNYHTTNLGQYQDNSFVVLEKFNTQHNISGDRDLSLLYRTNSNGKIKLDHLIPTTQQHSNNRILTEQTDPSNRYSLNMSQIQQQQNKKQQMLLRSSLNQGQQLLTLPPNQFQQSVQSNNPLNNSTSHNESLQLHHLSCQQQYYQNNQSYDHQITYKGSAGDDHHFLNISDIVLNQQEINSKEDNFQNYFPFQKKTGCYQKQKQQTKEDSFSQSNYTTQLNSNKNGNSFTHFDENKRQKSEQNAHFMSTKSQQQQSMFDSHFIQDYQAHGRAQENIQKKYEQVQIQLEQSQKENKHLKQQLTEEKSRTINLQIRLDQSGKKIKQLEKKNELLALEIDMNKKTFEMKCEALLKQLYNYQSLEPVQLQVQDKHQIFNNLQQINEYETLLDNFITINENGPNNILDISNSQVKNLQLSAAANTPFGQDPTAFINDNVLQLDKENIDMNIIHENSTNQLRQFDSKKGSVMQEYENDQFNGLSNQISNYNNTHTFDLNEFMQQTNPQSPFSNTNASKKLTMKLNQLNLINRNNQSINSSTSQHHIFSQLQ